MLDSRSTMVQCEIDAFFENLDQITLHCGGDVFANDVATEREWQPGPLFPPCSEVHHAFHAGIRVGQLALVNNQASVRCAACHRIEDSIERDHDMFELAEIKLQGKEGTGYPAWHSDRS